jgi:alpha-glucosidase (family GH31 glycosyl hydrolase)
MIDNKILGWHIRNNEMILQLQDSVLGLSFCPTDMLRLRSSPDAEFHTEETFIVLDPPAAQPFQLTETADRIIMFTPSLSLEIDYSPFSLRLTNSGGKILLATPPSRMLELRDQTSILRFLLEPDERIYGLGQDPMAQLNHRHQERRMWHEWGAWRRSGNAGIPFLFSNRGYGLLLNSAWPTRFAIGRAEVADPPPEVAKQWAPSPWGYGKSSGETNPDELAILLDEGIIDVFIVVRPSAETQLSAYVDLTGHAPMLPKWAFGFIQCKNRYRTQEELLFLANEFRQRQIPCDVMVIDWLWFKEFGDLHWLPTTFPDPQGMLTKLAKMGFRVMQAQHPFIDTPSQMYPIFKERGHLNQIPSDIETRPTYDHTNPAARSVWWQEIRRLYQDGIRSYWTDMGELEIHLPGTQSWLGSRERVHNIYSLLWTMGLYENQRREFGTRVFSLPRTAFAGIQRNSTALWSGDISSSWEVLKDQVVIGQGVCLSGQQYWCTDIGGFMYDVALTPELYVRWFEWGTFCPIFRTHGTRPDNEPWMFGAEYEAILSEYIQLRYRLMPYIYSLARQVTETGAPMMRAMVVDFGDDPVAVTQEHQFMFGPAFLVAPVVEKGARTRRVYLPQGEWYDYWTDQTYSGKQWIEVPVPLGRLPLFVRAGSLIPMSPVMQYVDEQPLEVVETHIYPGSVKAGFTLYEDDGLTYSYEQGAFVKTNLSFEDEMIKASYHSGNPKLIPASRQYVAVVHHPKPRAGIQVEVDHDLSHDGICTIHVLISNVGSPAKVTTSLYLPSQDWRVKGLQKQEIDVIALSHLQWEVIPEAQALPLIQRAKVEFEVKQDNDLLRFSRCIEWGSGWASRWQVIGHFTNEDGEGFDRLTLVETQPEQMEYSTGKTIVHWCRNEAGEFNPYGYVDFKSPALPDPGQNGVGYARCRIWSEEDQPVTMEVTGDPNLKIWLNGQVVYANPKIVLRQVISSPVTLRSGWNIVLVKTAFRFEKPWSGREYGFNFRLVNEQGKVIESLRYSPV